jgi:hypothetical protein
MARMQRSLFAQLNALAEEISAGAVKAAAEKSAEPTPADPGTYIGSSSHPTAHADNNSQPASTGARASEYEADVKKQQGTIGVDSTPEMSQEGRQDDAQLNLGLNAKSTGEDPANEKDYKGDKDDPGTAHPAKTNDGEKYSAYSFKAARDMASQLGNDILANLINFGTANLKKEAEMPAFIQEKIDAKKDESSDEKVEHESDCDDDDDEKEAAFKAGYELAKQLGLEKAAAEANVRDVCANTLREADEMADLLIGFLSTKQAGADPTDEAAEGEDHSAPGDDASGAGAAPAGLEAMMGGEEMGGEEMGGAEMGGAEMGGASEDDAVQELAMALEELGIPPEALLQMLSEEGAGGAGVDPAAAAGGMDPAAAGGMDPAAAGMGPAAAPKMAAAKKASELDEIGRAVINFKRSGKFQVKEARTKKSRQLRDMMKQHVIELVNR